MLQVILPNLVLFVAMTGLIVTVALWLARRRTGPRYHDQHWPDPPPAPPTL